MAANLMPADNCVVKIVEGKFTSEAIVFLGTVCFLNESIQIKVVF